MALQASQIVLTASPWPAVRAGTATTHVGHDRHKCLVLPYDILLSLQLSIKRDAGPGSYLAKLRTGLG